MKVLVTGGAGFIGSYVASAYLDAGHEVVVIDNLSTGRRDAVPSGAVFVEADIRDESVMQVFERERFDAVNHFAAQMQVSYSVREPLVDASINLMGTVNLLNAARLTGVGRFLFASSAGTVYGEQSVLSCDEDQPKRPLSPYGASKLSMEHYLHAFSACYGIQTLAMRYGNVYGPGQNPHGEAGVVAIFLKKLMNGQQPVIHGSGLQTRDYIYIDDVMRANVHALERPVSGALNITTDVETDVIGILDALRSASGIHCPTVHGPAMAGEPGRGRYANRRAWEVLQWRPEVGLQEGIAKTVAWEREHQRL
ncbi:MAG: NAD-dependent epimerase/dehydratase family protein [Candidatus Kapaibacterium sp.]